MARASDSKLLLLQYSKLLSCWRGRYQGKNIGCRRKEGRRDRGGPFRSSLHLGPGRETRQRGPDDQLQMMRWMRRRRCLVRSKRGGGRGVGKLERQGGRRRGALWRQFACTLISYSDSNLNRANASGRDFLPIQIALIPRQGKDEDEESIVSLRLSPTGNWSRGLTITRFSICTEHPRIEVDYSPGSHPVQYLY